MSYDLNPLNWNWQQAQAAGKHGLTAVGAVTATLVAVHFLDTTQQTEIVANVTSIYDGLIKVVTGIAGLVGVLTPIYGALKSAHNASPASQVTSVVKNLSAPEITQAANAVVDPTSRNKLIEAVAEMPEVKKIVPTDPALAVAVASPKVAVQ